MAGKPFYRPRNIVLTAVALLVFFVGYQVYLAVTATPGTAVDYAQKLGELAMTNQPTAEGRGAWPVLRAIIDRFNDAEAPFRDDDSGVAVDYSTIYIPHLKPTYDDAHSWEQVESLALRAMEAVRTAGVFDQLKDLTTCPRAIRPTPPGLLIGLLLPECARARQLTRLNGARMRKAHRENNEAEFVEAYEETLALGRIMSLQTTIIEHLVGIAIVVHANIQAREALTERPLSADACQRLLDAMDRQLPLAPLSGALEGERICALDIIQWTHTDDGHGSGRLILTAVATLGGNVGGAGLSQFSGWRIFNLASLGFPSKAANIAKANEFFDMGIAYSRLTPSQRRTAKVTPDEWMQNNLNSRFLVLNLCLPAIAKACASRTQCDFDIAATRTLIAVELFNARNHHYPTSLDELAPAVLPQVPADPYPAGRFVYRLLKPGEDHVLRGDGTARPYLLYSCGADGVDNDGREAKPNEISALQSSPAGRGFDYVVNRPKDRPPAPSDTQPAPSNN